MRSGTPATVASGIPVVASESAAVPQHKIPLAAKMAGTAFLAVPVPIYWRRQLET